MTHPLSKPLDLPCGATLSNRICKAAMSEGLADANNHATPRLETLYRRWSNSGAGLLLSGNVQVDRWHLERPGNIVLDDESGMAALTAMAKAGTAGGAHFWLQLSHTGRQVSDAINPAPLAPSSVEIDVPRGLGFTFAPPKEMTEADIHKVIGQFAFSARQARVAGFTGVQLHAAHGYLLSQFLSPLSNRRTDQWGGSLENRSRFLLEVIAAVRSAVGPDFPIAVKLNSADFQRGGFSFEDSQIVAGWLDQAGVDLIEISGGTYEQPKMANIEGMEPAFDPTIAKSTRDREAFFARFAPEMRRNVKRAKLMVTGGFRSVEGMADAIANDGIDLIGLGRPLCLYPDVPGALLRGELDQFEPWEHRLRLGPGLLGPSSSITLIKAINGFGTMNWYNEQLIRIANGQGPDPRMNFFTAFLRGASREKRVARALQSEKAS